MTDPSVLDSQKEPLKIIPDKDAELLTICDCDAGEHINVNNKHMIKKEFVFDEFATQQGGHNRYTFPNFLLFPSNLKILENSQEKNYELFLTKILTH